MTGNARYTPQNMRQNMRPITRPITRRKLLQTGLRLLVYAAAGITGFIIIGIIAAILIRGVPNLRPELFALVYTSENASMLPALVNTVIMTALSLVLAVPLGVFAAIYLAEYARRGNPFVRVVRLAVETLSGIPSIVYGLFGMLLFVVNLRWGYSIMAGSFTLAIMILPLVMRTAEEAVLAVPDAYREGSFGLGAGRLRTVFAVVLPPAAPGIFVGIILAAGRIIGESAALIFTAGTVAQIPKNLFSSGRTLAVHMYTLSSEGLYLKQAYASAVVLLALSALINTVSFFLAKKFSRL
ncbi:MAG: phosphate ABC transporter permease PstA [Spirochaetaceae bacterium]|jgi:phosphate transport system permease protein|nr:phosphate ABC transporter permease PstA [Spirochaetaceae bacterium]